MKDERAKRINWNLKLETEKPTYVKRFLAPDVKCMISFGH